jgi:hypothetical protein
LVSNDTAGYQAVAQDLLTHGYPTGLHFRAPGFPILLALTGSSEHLSRNLLYADLTLQFLAVAMLLSVLRKLCLPDWALSLICLVYLSPMYVEPAVSFQTEIPTAFLLIGCLWSITAKLPVWASGTVAGSLIGLAALTRPTYQLLAIPIFRSLSEKAVQEVLIPTLQLAIDHRWFCILQLLGFRLLRRNSCSWLELEHKDRTIC